MASATAAALVSMGDRRANRQGAVSVRAYKWHRKLRREKRGLWFPRVGLNSKETYLQIKQNENQNILKLEAIARRLSSRHENLDTL